MASIFAYELATVQLASTLLTQMLKHRATILTSTHADTSDLLIATAMLVDILSQQATGGDAARLVRDFVLPLVAELRVANVDAGGIR